MSWIVESYIIKRETIRLTEDIESDAYFDLMLIEKTYNYLQKNNLLSGQEVDVIEGRAAGFTFEEIGENLGISRITASAVFSTACDKIAFVLGDYFTDDGYLSYLQDKYSFSDTDLESIYEFMLSRNRHKMKRTNFLRQQYETN